VDCGATTGSQGAVGRTENARWSVGKSQRQTKRLLAQTENVVEMSGFEPDDWMAHQVVTGRGDCNPLFALGMQSDSNLRFVFETTHREARFSHHEVARDAEANDRASAGEKRQRNPQPEQQVLSKIGRH
jgi:hypothetical protein